MVQIVNPYINPASAGGAAPLLHAENHKTTGVDPLTPQSIGASPEGHNHNADYSPLSHNHDLSYSGINHNHNADYSALGHNHNGVYAPLVDGAVPLVNLPETVQNTLGNDSRAGFWIDLNSSSPTAVGYHGVLYGMTLEQRKAWFNNLYELVLLKDGVTYKIVDKTNWTKDINGNSIVIDGSDGSLCIRLPKLYTKHFIDNNKLHCYIDTSYFEGASAKAHVFGETVFDYLYIGVCEAILSGTKLVSGYSATVKPTATLTIDQFRNYANANGTGYGIMNWNTLSLIQDLFVCVYGTLNSQSIGAGFTNANNTASCAVGAGISITGGMTQGGGDTIGVCYLNLVNMHGNVWKFIDGWVKNGGIVKVNPKNNGESLTTGLTSADWLTVATNYNQVGSWQYISGFNGHDNAPYLASAVGGSSATYCCDPIYSSDGERLGLSGAGWGNASVAGLFALCSADVLSHSGSALGARLQCLSNA